MTEIGMALSNPLHGERLPGRVGSPLPGVAVRLVDDDGNEVGDGIPGEIQVAATPSSPSTGTAPMPRRTLSTDRGSAPATWRCVRMAAIGF